MAETGPPENCARERFEGGRAAGYWGEDAVAWRSALKPLTPDQRQMFVDTLRAYERGIADAWDEQAST
jgi:hypothetical protein